jgi:hypothetical protein
MTTPAVRRPLTDQIDELSPWSLRFIFIRFPLTFVAIV